MTTAGNIELRLLLGMTVALLAITGLRPFDQLTWFLEVFPVLVAIAVLAATRKSFPLTRLLYWLIFVHALILMVGGHYTYARVPLGFWVQELFDLGRNHYDRLGHVAQGFVPAMIAREVLLRRSPLVRGKWLFFLVLCVCAFVTVVYEFIEWWVALIAEGASIEFLGTQGDVWDTHWDMFLALCGALGAQLLLARVHDRQLAA
ncbi:MAG: Inner membrane protein YjdF [Pseudomonadales bacterium]|nr:Inner membrane protein YjdF [Pseudomonadales bacterium]